MSERSDDRGLTDRKFYKAKQEAAFSEAAIMRTPQTQHPAYRLAFQDTDFLLREDLRPIRFQLELLKPEMLLEEAGVGSTLVFYGSARIPAPDQAAHFEGQVAVVVPYLDAEAAQRFDHGLPAFDAFAARHVGRGGDGVGHTIQIMRVDQQCLLHFVGCAGQ